MRILFVRPRPVLPESFAGTQITLHWLCRRLKANGHEAVLAATTGNAAISDVSVDEECGYPVFRSPYLLRAARAAFDRLQPEVLVVTQGGSWVGMLPEAVRNLPVVFYEHEVSKGLGGVPE